MTGRFQRKTKRNQQQREAEQLTWSKSVIPIIPMKRWLLVTPLKTFISSGFRALNSLNNCRKTYALDSNLQVKIGNLDCLRKGSVQLTWHRTNALKINVFFNLFWCVKSPSFNWEKFVLPKLKTRSIAIWYTACRTKKCRKWLQINATFL